MTVSECDFCKNFGTDPTAATWISQEKMEMASVLGLAEYRHLYVCQSCYEALIEGGSPEPGDVTTKELVRI